MDLAAARRLRRRPLSALLAHLHLWAARRRSRIALSRLGAQHLADCGLTPEAAARESARPFWRA